MNGFMNRERSFCLPASVSASVIAPSKSEAEDMKDWFKVDLKNPAPYAVTMLVRSSSDKYFWSAHAPAAARREKKGLVR